MRIDPLVRIRVDKCHISMGPFAVLKAFCRIKGTRAIILGLPRTQRRELLRQIFARHIENQNKYNYVMNGGLR